MKRLVSLALILVVGASSSFAQAVPQPSHLIIATPNGVNGYCNPDSLQLDTTVTPNQLCAKRFYSVTLTSHPFHDSAAADTNGAYGINDFDDTHVDYFLWSKLDSMTGGLLLHTIITLDTLQYFKRHFQVSFLSYIRVDTVLSYFEAMDSVTAYDLDSKAIRLLSSPSDPASRPLNSLTQITGTTTTPNNDKRYRMLGYQYNLYLSKVPLAWEITKGRNQVAVGIADNVDESLRTFTSHQDLHKVSDNGNCIFPGLDGSGNLSLYGGSTFIRPVQQDHGLANLGIIAAEENAVGMVGFAPSVRVFNTSFNKCDFSQVDVSSAPSMQLPHVMSCSFESRYGTISTYVNAIENGVVVISTGPNEELQGSYDPYTGNPYEIGAYPSDYNEPRESDLGGLVITHTTDPDLDVKVLAVVQYSDILVRGGTQACPTFNSFGFGPLWSYNQPMCLGLNKFDTGDEDHRRSEKRNAFIDVVVPENYLGLLLDGSTSKYEEYCKGNSRAVPQVSAIVGLMNSVHDRLGVTGRDVQRRVYDIVTFTADKIVDLQPEHTVAQSVASEANSTVANFSEILTETPQGGSPVTCRSFKVPNRVFLDLPYSDLIDGSGKLRTAYINQTNDALHRYWAPRFGFGRVNAFRCVAHSIPGKNSSGQANVKYQYSGSDAIDWANGHALGGSTYLHFGKFKDATTEVLTGGGVAYSGEPAYMNNNGKTLVDADLVVGTSQTLVIDGILTTTLSGSFKKISTGTTTGRILATGWVENVDLEGLVRASDLRIKRTISGTALKTTGTSELHDETWLHGHGDIVVSSGTLTLQPGSTVYLYDDAKIIVKAGATLKLSHGSRILDKESAKIAGRIVLEAKSGANAGGKLIIDSKAEEVAIDAEVVVNDDAEFTVNDAEGEAYPGVWINKVTVEAGGKFVVADRAFIKRYNPATTTPSVILKSASGLVVANGTSVRLDVPVEVQSGSKIEVGTSATLKVGALTVQSNAKLKAGAGSTVQFLDETNIVRGICIAEGTSTSKAKFTATNETSSSCSSLARTNIARLTIEPDKWIYNTNSPGSTSLDQVLTCYFHAQNAEFTNVYTTINSAPILWWDGTNLQAGTMKNCDFRADRRVYVAAGMEAAFRNANLTLLNCDYSRGKLGKLRAAATGVPLSLLVATYKLTGSLELASCDFHDLGGGITSGDYRKLTQKTNDYPVNGFYSNLLPQVTVSSCRLAFLHFGLSSKYGQCNVSNSVFGGHADAIHCRNAQICSTAISGSVNCVNIEAGSVGLKENTLGGTMNSSVNPLFGSSESVEYIGSGLFINVGAISECRNNSLSKFGTGFHAFSGIINASDRFAFLAPTQAERGKVEVSGRNEFQSISGSFPYLKSGEKSHIYVNTGNVRLECGRNMFSMPTETSRYQLFKLAPGTISVKVNENTFDKSTSFPTIKRNSDFLVSDESTYVDEGERLSGATCEYYLRTLEVELDCTQLPVADPNAFSATYVLSDIDPLNVETFRIVVPSWNSIDSNYAKEIFIVSKYWLSDHSQSVGVRLNAIDFAVQSTTVHPKSDSVSMVLIDTLQPIVRDTTQDVSLRGKALTGCVELLSNLELFDVGKVWFDSVRTGLFHDYDSVSIENLSAWLGVMADTTLSLADRTDTLNALTNASVELAKRPDGLGKIRSPQISKGIEQWDFELQPNPAGEHVAIQFNGDKVNNLQIRLVDMYGVDLMRTSHRSIVNGDFIDIDLSGVRNGMYLVELSDGLHHMSRIMCVVH